MTYDWQVFGHKKQLEFLEKALTAGRLPHGLLFAGPDGVGKLVVARRLAQILLCETSNACASCGQCKTFVAQSNADYMEISGTENIKIEQIRDLTYKLSLKPYAAQYKVAIIDAAEEMTEEAANALLKNLEEPKDHTIIVLVTSNPNRLPKTIVSRAQKINFGLVREEEYSSILPAKLSASQKQLISTQAIGRPGMALRIASSDELLERLEEVDGYLARISSGKTSERLVAGAELADWESPELDRLFVSWLNRLRQEMQNNPGAQTLRQAKAVSEGQLQLQRNGNTKLVLANLMLNI